MTTDTVCPDFPVLSQFLDHELESEETKRLELHVASCAACRTQVRHIERAESLARTRFVQSLLQPVSLAPSSECLSPETISAYVQRMLVADKGKQVEKHLQTCNGCLSEVMEASRLSAALAVQPNVVVPTTLKARVAALWQAAPAEAQPVSLSRLVIQIAQKGLRLLEENLVAPLLEVQPVFAPAPAYRAGDNLTVLNLKIDAGQTVVDVTVVQEGTGVALRLTFRSAEQEILTGKRVFLHQHGSAVFSAKTDADGFLRTPRLEPGLYAVSCPETQTGFELELRPSV